MNRECMYCKKLFSCEAPDGVRDCLNFTPRSASALERYKEWKQECNKIKRCEMTNEDRKAAIEAKLEQTSLVINAMWQGKGVDASEWQRLKGVKEGLYWALKLMKAPYDVPPAPWLEGK